MILLLLPRNQKRGHGCGPVLGVLGLGEVVPPGTEGRAAGSSEAAAQGSGPAGGINHPSRLPLMLPSQGHDAGNLVGGSPDTYACWLGASIHIFSDTIVTTAFPFQKWGR